MGLGLSALVAGLGAVFMLTGGGLAWAVRAKKEDEEVKVPDTVLTAMVEEQQVEELVR
jgi:hypothetical protein